MIHLDYSELKLKLLLFITHRTWHDAAINLDVTYILYKTRNIPYIIMHFTFENNCLCIYTTKSFAALGYFTAADYLFTWLWSRCVTLAMMFTQNGKICRARFWTSSLLQNGSLKLLTGLRNWASRVSNVRPSVWVPQERFLSCVRPLSGECSVPYFTTCTYALYFHSLECDGGKQSFALSYFIKCVTNSCYCNEEKQ